MPVFKNFHQFWPFYLGEHAHPLNRRLHFIGSTIVIMLTVVAAGTGSLTPLLWIPFFGYGFAWYGHFVVEKNRPATFKHPLWSLRGDFRMLRLALTGQLPAELDAIKQHASQLNQRQKDRSTH